MTLPELVAMAEKVRADPDSANPGYARGSIYLYKPAARRKLDAIGWAITYHLADLKKKATA